MSSSVRRASAIVAGVLAAIGACTTSTGGGGSGTYGDVCQVSSDCGYGPSPVCVAGPGSPDAGGSAAVVSGICTSECQTATACGVGFACVADSLQTGDAGLTSGCQETCSPTAPCSNGTACEASDGGVDICVVACGTNSDCVTGKICDPTTGECHTGTSPANYCTTCTTDQDCVAGGSFCVQVVPTADTGVCGAPCTTDSDCPLFSSCDYITDSDGDPLGSNCLPDNSVCQPADAGPMVDAGLFGTEDAGTDAGTEDAGIIEDGGQDAGAVDAGTMADAGPADAGLADAGPTDAGPADAGAADAGLDGGI